MAISFDPFLGPYDLEAGWVPSLRYLMRRDRILQVLNGVPPASLLEVGCGAGMLLAELSVRGFACVGLETSTTARQLAQQVAIKAGNRYQVVHEADADWSKRFVYLAAFDVLEHIEHDADALRQWREWMQDDGRLLLSVPAHAGRWGPGDEWAGHFRRYGASQLRNLLDECGYRIDHFECYGFPIANLTERLGSRSYARLLAQRSNGTSHDEATALSGVDRKPYLRVFPFMRSLPGKGIIWMGLRVQSISRRTDWGSGYFVVARKR